MPSRSSSSAGAAFPPEVQLLLLCVQANPHARPTGRMEALLKQGIDWDDLLRIAHAHKVAPLLYRGLRDTCPEGVPQAILDVLQEHLRHITRRNLFLTGELFQIVRLFAEHHIAVIPYKGPTLAVLAYGNLTLREFVDLDLVIRKEDVAAAGQLLLSRAYQTSFSLSGGGDAALLEYGHERGYFRAQEQLLVELHWRFAERYFSCELDPEQLGKQLIAVSACGHRVTTFTPEDLLLILSFHGARHLWGQLRWICDIAWLIAGHPSLNWEQVMGQAHRTGVSRTLLLALFLAADLLGASLSTWVWQRIAENGAIRPLAARVCAGLVHGGAAGPGLFQRTLFHLRARERLRDRVRHCLEFAFRPTQADLRLFPVPPSCNWMYYILRPFRLAGKYGRQSLG